MRAVAGWSSGLEGRSTPASGRYYPSRPRFASCTSLEPTVRVPATALYAMDCPSTVIVLSVTESGGGVGTEDLTSASLLGSDLSCANRLGEAMSAASRAAAQASLVQSEDFYGRTSRVSGTGLRPQYNAGLIEETGEAGSKVSTHSGPFRRGPQTSAGFSRPGLQRRRGAAFFVTVVSLPVTA